MFILPKEKMALAQKFLFKKKCNRAWEKLRNLQFWQRSQLLQHSQLQSIIVCTPNGIS